MNADAAFDLTVEAIHGDSSVDAPPWVHGIAFQSSPNGIADGFHLRTWLPNLPPTIDLSVSRAPNFNGQDWAISMGLEDWVPAHSELMIHAYGINGQDMLLTLQGLNVGEPTSLLIDSIFEIRTTGGITEVGTTTHYWMSNRLDWVHALLINREAGSRTEIMIHDLSLIHI